MRLFRVRSVKKCGWWDSNSQVGLYPQRFLRPLSLPISAHPQKGVRCYGTSCFDTDLQPIVGDPSSTKDPTARIDARLPRNVSLPYQRDAMFRTRTWFSQQRSHPFLWASVTPNRRTWQKVDEMKDSNFHLTAPTKASCSTDWTNFTSIIILRTSAKW